MRVLIIEDENRSANRLVKLLLEIDPNIKVIEKIALRQMVNRPRE